MLIAVKIGIDIGGTSVSCALIGEDMSVLSKISFDTNSGRAFNEVIREISEAVFTVLNKSNRTLDDVESVGIGCPGIIDRKKGMVIYSNNIAWENVPFVSEFQKLVPKETYIDNDANCAALGEYLCGAAQGADSSVMVSLGTGVGGGIILSGKIYNGFNSAANVIGHMVTSSEGELCTCGRRGCWETYASVTALIRMADEMAVKFPSSLLAKVKGREGCFNGKNIFSAGRSNDYTALKLLERYYFYVAEGIINIINILQPQVIVIGGGISVEKDYLLSPIINFVKKGVYCKQVPLPRITVADLGNDAGIIGAAYLKSRQ